MPEGDPYDSNDRSNPWIVLIVALVAGGVAAAMLTGRSISKVSPAAARADSIARQLGASSYVHGTIEVENGRLKAHAPEPRATLR